MNRKLQVFKCLVCKNIVELVEAGGGNLVCCGQSMKLMKENKVEASAEKHIPVVDKTEEGIKVRVGSEAHPMDDKHYIQWIEVITGQKVYHHFLKPGDSPQALFSPDSAVVKVRAYCNLHGLWSND
jgi:superoxide reductase